MAGYDEDKPAGTDTIASSDDLIRSNFVQIVANITNQHVWDDSDATKVIHNRAAGIITRNMTSASGAVDETISIPHAFTPTLVIFDWQYLNGTAVELCVGKGYYDGTDNKNIYYVYMQTAAPTVWTSVVTAATNAIVLRDDGSNHQVAACTFGASKLTLTWTKTASPTGIANIRYVAFG